MAQLRDAHTSEIVFEGTPLECALAAQKLGGAAVLEAVKAGAEQADIGEAELLYDDVGLGFDPEAAIEAAEERAAGLERSASEAKGAEGKRLAAAASDAKEALRPDAKRVSAAKRAVERARKLRDAAAGA